jgi:putative redox protein
MKTELTVRAVHKDGMQVLATDGQFDVLMDYPLESGNTGAGPTPLTMLLASLAACSLNSVLVVLQKMHQPLAGLNVEASAIRSSEHPTVLTGISLEFTVRGEAVESDKVAQALQMSEERLCPVWNMLKAGTPIRASFRIQKSALSSVTAN